MNESETRAELIDPALRKAGWGVVEDSRIRREFLIIKGRLKGYGGKRTSTLSTDYMLVYKNRNLAEIADEQKRILLTLATGIGKTDISFQIAWKLFHAKWNLRGDFSRRPRIADIPSLFESEEEFRRS